MPDEDNRQKSVELTPEIRASIEGYDFSAVECLTAPKLVKDPATLPALVQVLGLPPGEAPGGETPDEVSDTPLWRTLGALPPGSHGQWVGSISDRISAKAGKQIALDVTNCRKCKGATG